MGIRLEADGSGTDGLRGFGGVVDDLGRSPNRRFDRVAGLARAGGGLARTLGSHRFDVVRGDPDLPCSIGIVQQFFVGAVVGRSRETGLWRCSESANRVCIISIRFRCARMLFGGSFRFESLFFLDRSYSQCGVCWVDRDFRLLRERLFA